MTGPGSFDMKVRAPNPQQPPDTPPKLHTDRDFGRTAKAQAVQDVFEHPPEPSEPESASEDPLRESPPHEDYLTSFVKLPVSINEMTHELHALTRLITDTSIGRPWAPFNTPLSNAAGTNLTLNSGTAVCWVLALNGFAYTRDLGIELTDIMVGTNAPQIVQIVACPNIALDPGVPTRLIGTVRTTSAQLSQWFPPQLVLRNGESLLLVAQASTVSFDFSARYRNLRS